MTDRHRYIAVLVAASIALAGCAKGPKDNEYVRYRGSVLQVEGNDYVREGDGAPAATGRILVDVRNGQRDAALARLEAFGLESEGDTRAGTLRVKVPDGFEAQWMQALSMEPAIASTHADDASQPTTPPGAAVARVAGEPATGAPVPDAPPSAAVVAKLTRRMYAAMEANGGMPLVLTATGKQFVVHQQLADVVSEGCKRLPGSAPGEYECGVLLKVRSCNGDCDPSAEEALDDAKRIDVRWDAKTAEWVLG